MMMSENQRSSPGPITLSRGVSPSALCALVAMTIGRLARGRRLVVLAALFLLPTVIALLGRKYADPFRPAEAEEALIFYMIPQALLPLTALVFASGMIQDEVEDQTLTYLLIRPVPRWSIYAAKLLGTFLVSATVTAFFTLLTIGVIRWGEADFVASVFGRRGLGIALISVLATLVYTSIFGCLSLIFKRVLVIGVAYVILFEGLFANIDFVIRRGTVMWNVRVVAARRLDLNVPSWAIDLETALSARTCLINLLAASLISTIIAGFLISMREFRLKTPEGT